MKTASLENLRMLFQSEGFDIRFVGGCVRDYLLGAKPKDIDLHTNAFPDEQLAMYKKYNFKYVLTGFDHGTITLFLDGISYEITSLRTDDETDGRHAKVSFSRDWLIDLSRRDLTINAISMDFDGNIIDPFEGQYHLMNNRVKFVGDANLRVQEDYLRILRFFRFHSRFGNEFFDLDAIQAIEKNVAGLRNVSTERIQSEFYRTLPTAKDYLLQQMNDLGVLKQCGINSFDLSNYRRIWNVSDHNITLLMALTNSNPPDWKFSREEVRMIEYMKKNKKPYENSFEMMKEVVNGTLREFVTENAYLTNSNINDINDFVSLEVPVFPISGKDLLDEGFNPGVEMGKELKRRKRLWIENGFS